MPKVLLIEDEKIFIELFGDRLRLAGFEVSTAENGAWGLKESMKENFDLFIIDMMMPAMTGEEVIAKLKMDDKTKNVPIIVLSASVDEEAQRRVEKMGVHSFLLKTRIAPGDLAQKALEILKRGD